MSPPQHAHKVDREPALEIFFLRNRRAAHRMPHRNRVEHEVGRENAERENEERGVWRHHAGLRRGGREVQVHGAGDEAIEKRHQHAAHDRKDDTLAHPGFSGFSGISGFSGFSGFQPIRHRVAQNRRDNQRDAAEQHHGVALWRTDVVDHHAENERETDAHRERHAHPRKRQVLPASFWVLPQLPQQNMVTTQNATASA